MPSQGLSKLIAAVQLAATPAGANRMLVHCRATDVACELPVDEACLLLALDSFQSLAEHQERLLDTIELSEAQTIALPALLKRSREQGLLISAAELLARFSAAAPSYTPPPPISTLAVLTCERPQMLRRALLSYVQNTRHFGRRCTFAVFDDSRHPEGRANTRALLQALARQEGVTIGYAGDEEKRCFADLLVAESGVASEIVQFALWGMADFGTTCGANRNAVLLHTTGELVVSFDDDTVCQVAAPPERSAGLQLAPGGISAWDHWYCADRAATQRVAVAMEHDVLAIHEEALGKRLDACIAETRGKVDFGAMPAALLGRVLDHADGRILVTMNGLFGVSGYGAPLIALRGDSFSRLVASESGYRSALSSAEMVRAVPALTLSMDAAVAGGFLGLDNRELLPPFMPICRGEDTIFGALLQELYPGSMQAFLPWLLLHSPPDTEDRRYAEDAVLMDARSSRTPLLTLAVLAHLRPPRLPAGAARLRALGTALIELSDQPMRGFVAELRAMVLRCAGQELGALEELLSEQQGAPAFWASDMRRYIETARHHAVRPEFIVPSELRAGRSSDEALRLLQQALHRFGRLLDAWPALVSAARRLRSGGQQLINSL